jgi:hypothetical protein
VVDKSTPIRASAFSPHKFFSGTVAIEIGLDSSTTSGEVFDFDYVEKNRKQLQSSIDHLIKENSPNQLSFDTMDGSWEPCLGGGGSFAGLYASESREKHDYKRSLWLVVHSGAPKISKDVYGLIEDIDINVADGNQLVPASDTWGSFFFTNPKVRKAERLAQANRNLLASNLARSLNLSDKNHFWKPRADGKMDLVPTAETRTNYVSEKANHICYFNKTVDFTEDVNKFVFADGPWLGATILTNPRLKTSDPSKRELISKAFPASAGRSLSVKDPKFHDLTKKTENRADNIFIWDNKHLTSKDSVPQRLVKGLYKSSLPLFEKADQIGFQFEQQLHLKPLLVKICSSDSE